MAADARHPTTGRHAAPRSRTRASVRLWLLSLLLLAPVAVGYLRHVPPGSPLRGRVFAVLALFATLGLLSLPLAAVVSLARTEKRMWLFAWLCVVGIL